MRKIISLLLSFLLIVSLSVTVSAETSDPALSVGSLTVDPGEEFTVPVSIRNNLGVISLVLEISYPEVLTLVKVEDLALLPNGIIGPTNQNPLSISWIAPDAQSDTFANGDLLHLTFKLSETAAAGSNHSITIDYDPENVFDYNLDNMPFVRENGIITVSGTPDDSGNNGNPTDPTDPGSTDPTDPGSTDPTDPGSTDPTDPGSTDPTDPGSTDPTDPGSTDPTDPGSTDPGNTGDSGSSSGNSGGTGGSSSTPNTGDRTPVALLIALASLSFLGMCVLIYLFIKNPSLFKRSSCLLLALVMLAGIVPLSTIVHSETGDGTTTALVLTEEYPLLLNEGQTNTFTITPNESNIYSFSITSAVYGSFDDPGLSLSIDGLSPLNSGHYSNTTWDHIHYAYALEQGQSYTVNVTSSNPTDSNFILRAFKGTTLAEYTAENTVTNELFLPYKSVGYAMFTPSETGKYSVYQVNDELYSPPSVYALSENGQEYLYEDTEYYVDGYRRLVYTLQANVPHVLIFDSDGSENKTIPVRIERPPIATSISISEWSAYVLDSYNVRFHGITVEPADALTYLSFQVENPNGTELQIRSEIPNIVCDLFTGSVPGVAKLIVTDSISGLSASANFNITARPVATDMYLDQTTLSMYSGDSSSLFAYFGPEQSKEEVIYTIKEDDDPDNDDLVTIDEFVFAGSRLVEACYINAHPTKTGTVTVVAESKETHIKDECVVHVVAQPTAVTGLSLQSSLGPSRASLLVGQEDYLSFYFLPEGLPYEATWNIPVTVTSSDPEVVYLPNTELLGDTSFAIRGLKVGTAEVTASCTTQSGETFTDTITVTVEEKVATESINLEVVGIAPKTDDAGTYYKVSEGANIYVKYNRYPANANDELFAEFDNYQSVAGGGGNFNDARFDMNNSGETTLTVYNDNVSQSIRIKVLSGVVMDDTRSYDAYLNPNTSTSYTYTPSESGYYVFHTNNAQSKLELKIVDTSSDFPEVISTSNSVNGEYGCGAYLEAGTTYRLVCENNSKFSVYSYLLLRKAKTPTTVSIASKHGHNLTGKEERFYPTFDSVEHYGPVRWTFTEGRGIISNLSFTDHWMDMFLASSGYLGISATLSDDASATHRLYIKADIELDVDGNDKPIPDEEDVNALCYYITGYSDQADETVADINGNNDINAKDAVILSRHINSN